MDDSLRRRAVRGTGRTRSPRERDVPLAMDAETFRRLGHRLVDRIAARLEAIPDGPVTPGESATAVREAFGLGGPLPEEGTDAAALLERTTEQLFDHSLFNGHPRFFGYITSSPAPIGMLGDLLAAAVNPNSGAWILSPAATEIEAETVRWIAELIGCPSDTGGLLVSGGNMANLVGFFAARAAKADWNVRQQGVVDAKGRRLRVYGSAETHTWIQKATDLAGMGTDSIRWIPTNDDLCIDVDALEKAIAEDRQQGDVPFMVCGTAGSVSTGAVDDLERIAELCRSNGIWFHVDGAYGALAAAVPGAPEALRGMRHADSVAVDPHKWLYAPLEAGCALVRNPDHLRAAFSYHPPYYHFEEQVTNFVELGPQNSRGFRALKVWLALRQAGASGYRRMIADDIRLSAVMAEAVRAEPLLEFVTQALSITTWRYVPEDLRERASDPQVAEYLNTLNQELLDRMQRGGEAFVSNAVIRGCYVLRACIVNFNTERADVEATVKISARMGGELDARMRPAELAAGKA